MQLPVYRRDGTKSAETIEIPDELITGTTDRPFEPNDHAIWLAVRSEEAASHQGTHATKCRKFVRGGGRKPFRQKGRGMARQGTIRSPLNPGGGTVFGPQPHDYHVKLPEKVRRLARRSALVYKMREDKIKVIEDFSQAVPKTNELVSVFSALGLKDEKILYLTGQFDPIIARSARNVSWIRSQKAEAASTRDIVSCSTVLLQKSAVEQMLKVLDHAS